MACCRPGAKKDRLINGSEGAGRYAAPGDDEDSGVGEQETGLFAIIKAWVYQLRYVHALADMNNQCVTNYALPTRFFRFFFGIIEMPKIAQLFDFSTKHRRAII